MSLEEPSQDFPTQPSPANPPRKRPVSERRIQANRKNALRSTGPRTARGKRTVACNAIKHGLLAREVVITAGEGEENLKEFHTLLEGLWNYYEPVGVVEEALVQTIANCWWRKARVIRAENGEIRKRLDTHREDRAFGNSDRCNFDLVSLQTFGIGRLFNNANQADQQVSSKSRSLALQEIQSTVRGHPSGLAYLAALLMMAKSEMTSEGHIAETVAREVFDAFCLWDYLFALTVMSARPPAEKGKGSPSEEVEKVVDKQADRRGAAVIEFIDKQLKRIRLLEKLAEKREELTRDAEARSFSLPPADATDKLLRYEAHLDRQLYRAMDELERVQRRRRGEKVPPPLNINLSRRN